MESVWLAGGVVVSGDEGRELEVGRFLSIHIGLMSAAVPVKDTNQKGTNVKTKLYTFKKLHFSSLRGKLQRKAYSNEII